MAHIKNYRDITQAFGGAHALRVALPTIQRAPNAILGLSHTAHAIAPSAKSTSLRLLGDTQPQNKLTNVHRLQPQPHQGPQANLQQLMQDIPAPEAQNDGPQNQLNAQPGFRPEMDLPEPTHRGPGF